MLLENLHSFESRQPALISASTKCRKTWSQLKIIQDEEAKGKSSAKAQDAVDELSYLMIFNLQCLENVALIRLCLYKHGQFYTVKKRQ